MKNAELLVGKTIASIVEREENEHRYWIVLTFTDGTQAKILAETDYSDQRSWVNIKPVTESSPETSYY